MTASVPTLYARGIQVRSQKKKREFLARLNLNTPYFPPFLSTTFPHRTVCVLTSPSAPTWSSSPCSSPARPAAGRPKTTRTRLSSSRTRARHHAPRARRSANGCRFVTAVRLRYVIAARCAACACVVVVVSARSRCALRGPRRACS